MIKCKGCGNGVKVLRSVEFKGIPFRVHLCDVCVAAGAIPYDLLLTFVWLGEVKVTEKWAIDVAIYHGYSSAQFESDCANFSDKMDEIFKER